MNTIKAIIHHHEGFSYAEFNGEFYKGCKRCGGTGHFSFNGMDSICYLCGDSAAKLGDKFASEDDAKKWCHGKEVARQRRIAKQEEVRLAKLAKRQSAWDALAAGHPMVWGLIGPITTQGYDYNERDRFVATLAEKLWSLDEVGYSPRQLEVLQQIAEKRVASQEEAAQHPVPEGRQVVTGEIIGTKVVEGDYGTAYKITVKDDRGFRIYVSMPKAQSDEAYDTFVQWVEDNGYSLYDFGPSCFFLGTQDEKYPSVKGRRITFTATLTRSGDDEAFGFGSRPTKGAWL